MGEAWSCLLWDLRKAVGPGVADAIAFHSLHYLSPAADYAAARAALEQADAGLFPSGARAGTAARSMPPATPGCRWIA